jgi:hypothetical protein
MKPIKTEHDLTVRKQELEERIASLESELMKGWNEELSRQLNILNHHLRVCEERLNGEWFKDDYSDDIEELPFRK